MKTDHQRARQYYDRVADDYDSGFRREGDLIDRREKEILRSRLGDLSGRRAFDFGCGTGRISQFHRECGAARVLGVDLSPRMVEIARSKVDDPAVEFRVYKPAQGEPAQSETPQGQPEQGSGSAADPKLADEEPFDLVSSLEVLEYFAEPRDFFSILATNVAEGGDVVFDFINRQNLSARLKSWLSRDWRDNGIRLYSLGQARRMCAAEGLEVTSSDGVYMSLLPISIHSRIPVIGTRWLALERVLNRSRLLRRFLSYRILMVARKVS